MLSMSQHSEVFSYGFAIWHQNRGTLTDDLVMHTTDMHLVSIAELLPKLGEPLGDRPIRGRTSIEGVILRSQRDEVRHFSPHLFRQLFDHLIVHTQPPRSEALGKWNDRCPLAPTTYSTTIGTAPFAPFSATPFTDDFRKGNFHPEEAGACAALPFMLGFGCAWG